MTVGIRVLAVEDDERIRASVKLALEDEGWIVDEAASGEEAIAIFAKHPADVVLIDIMLPGIDGFELCRNIRKSSDVPIVMVTARADNHDVVAGLEAGADDVESSEEGHSIWTSVDSLHEVAKALETALGEPEGVKLAWKPTTMVDVSEDDAGKLFRMIDTLEEDDDVQTVWGNYDVSDEIMEKLG